MFDFRKWLLAKVCHHTNNQAILLLNFGRLLGLIISVRKLKYILIDASLKNLFMKFEIHVLKKKRVIFDELWQTLQSLSVKELLCTNRHLSQILTSIFTSRSEHANFMWNFLLFSPVADVRCMWHWIKKRTNHGLHSTFSMAQGTIEVFVYVLFI